MAGSTAVVHRQCHQCTLSFRDDAQAKARVAVFTKSLGLGTMDIGPLSMARTLEHVCLLSLGLVANTIKHTNSSIGLRIHG